MTIEAKVMQYRANDSSFKPSPEKKRKKNSIERQMRQNGMVLQQLMVAQNLLQPMTIQQLLNQQISLGLFGSNLGNSSEIEIL